MPEVQDQDTPLGRYKTAISQYDTIFKKWRQRVQKIVKKYRDDTRNQAGSQKAKFNILWSNVQTLIPAVYAKLPKADVSRRFGDNDPIGRVASMILERALDYEIEHYPDFRATMRHSVEDRFLGGRGVAWVRYEPHVRAQDIPEDGLEITEDIEAGEDENGANEQGATEPLSDLTGNESAPEEIDYECAPTDYVYWDDFFMLPGNARTWEEVTAVGRWVYLNKDAFVERFGEEKVRAVNFNQGPGSLDNQSKPKDSTQAKICELWDKEKNKAFWFSHDGNDFLDVRDDPLDLEGFFPCPKPLFATTTSESLIPVPDLVLYQDQAAELDILSDRIDGLIKALKVRGVYDASVKELQRLMTEGDNNSLIPVENWMAFSEKNGLQGAIQLLPLDMIATALGQCYEALDNVKNQIYEITGISDIIRGQTAASETATAQQIKGQYAGLRLRSMQEDVALFATGLIQLKAEIMCTKFQDQTILQYAAADQLSPADQQMIPQAMQLLRQNPLQMFRIEVAADSLVQIDENQQKQERTEFLTAFGGFMEKALPIAQASPQMGPLIAELLKFGVGAFKQAKQLEGVIDQTLDRMNQAAQQPQAQRPDPAMARVQADQAADQARIQSEAQLEQMRMQHDAQIEQLKAQSDQQLQLWKAKLDAATKIMVAEISAKAGLDQSAIEAQITAAQQVNQDLSGQVQ